jgi:hypothetical protein
MNCNDYSDSIMRYFDSNLNDIESAQLKQHLKVCKKCSCEFEDMRLILSSLENDNIIEPPEDFEMKVMDRIKALQPSVNSVPESTIKFIYGFTSFLLILLLFMFTLNMMGPGLLESITSRFTALNSIFDIVISIRGFLGAIFSFIGDLSNTIIKMLIVIAKTYYYIIILAAVMLFAIQWMYVSLLKQFQGGHTR